VLTWPRFLRTTTRQSPSKAGLAAASAAKQVARTTDSVVRGFLEGRTADRKNGGPRYPAMKASGGKYPGREGSPSWRRAKLCDMYVGAHLKVNEFEQRPARGAIAIIAGHATRRLI